jgi:zinc protease
VRKPSDLAKVAMGYKAPAMAHPDHGPLVLLNEMLFGGLGSRAHRRLVKERELCSEAHGYVGNFRDPSLWDIYLTARAPHAPATLVDALDELFAELIEAPVAEEELGRARARIELSTLQGLDTAMGKADQIGFAETVLGDPAAIFTRLGRYAAVDPDEVLRVARTYLEVDRRTVIEVLTDREGTVAS